MTGIISPRSILNCAYEDLEDEEGKLYFYFNFIVVPILLGASLAYLIDIDSSLLNYLGTTLSIVAGFSINAIFTLINKVEVDKIKIPSPLPRGIEDEEEYISIFEEFFEELRHYTSLSIIVVLLVLAIIFLIKAFSNNLALEILLFSTLIHYIQLLLVVIRRVDTIVKRINF